VQELRDELLRRGIAPGVAAPLAERLAGSLARLEPAACAIALDGVAAAIGVQRERGEAHPLEIQRLVQDFAAELKKLDEGLRLLSAYLLRLRDRAGADGDPRIVH
jgi:hypothetical protein